MKSNSKTGAGNLAPSRLGPGTVKHCGINWVKWEEKLIASRIDPLAGCWLLLLPHACTRHSPRLAAVCLDRPPTRPPTVDQRPVIVGYCSSHLNVASHIDTLPAL